MDEHSKIVVFGGSGFLGHYVVKRLAKSNARIVIVGRSAAFLNDFSVTAAVGQVSFAKLPSADAQWNHLLTNATHVVNLMGIMFPNKNENFHYVHAELAGKVAHFSRLNKVFKLVHISALMCKGNKSSYSASKIAGERAVLKEFPEATILRPSVMVGFEDKFLNLFAKIIQYSFVVPLIAWGKTKLQPVYVDDVAAVIEKCCEEEILDSRGKIFELAGEKQFSIKQLMKMLAVLMHKKRIFIPIPFSLSLMMGYILQVLPFKLLTADQVMSLQKNNVLTADNGLEVFGVKPTNVHFLLEKYIK